MTDRALADRRDRIQLRIKLVPDAMGEQRAHVVADLRLRRRRERLRGRILRRGRGCFSIGYLARWGRCLREATKPPLDRNRLHFIKRHTSPLRDDVRFEVIKVALNCCRRPIDVRVAQFIGLKMGPGFPHSHHSNRLLFGCVDFGSEVFDCLLRLCQSRETSDRTNDPAAVDSSTVRLRWGPPPVNPAVRPLGAVYFLEVRGIEDK